MSFAKGLRHITALLIAITFVTAQSRDEVIELINPVTGSMVDTNFIDVEISVADFFSLGSPGCSDCDGYVQATMDGTDAGQITSITPLTITGLSEGSHFIEIEALDPSGASFSTVVYDSATFTVDMESVPNLCPPRNLSVTAGDTRDFLYWSDPIAMSNLNPFPAIPQSADYHTGSTNGSSFIQNSLIMAYGGPADSKEAGWAMFDIAGMNPSIVVDSIIFNYYVNATNWPYWSATPVRIDPLTSSASEVHTEILAGTDAATAYLYQNESSSFSPGWYSNVLLNGANTDLEDDIPQGFFVIGLTDRDGSSTYYLDVDGWNETNPPSIEIYWSAPGGRQGVYHAPAIGDILFSEDEIMAYKNAVSKGLQIPTELERIPNYETARFPGSSPREVIEGCGDFQNYSIFTSDGTEIAIIDTNYYLHDNLTNGSEYCYYIVANYTEGASSATETVCATPETFIPAGITNLVGVGLHESAALSWTDPSVPQYTLFENFNSGIPGTWTVSDNNGSGITWLSGEDGPAQYTLDDFDGAFAIVTSYSETFPNTDLISPSIDLSNYTSATLHYNFNYQDFATNPTDSGLVYISGDGGTTWTLMNSYYADTPPGGLDAALADSVSLNSVVGNSDVKIKFHYEVESGESWFFAVDDIIIVGTESTGRDMTGSTVSTFDTYIPGNTHTIEFSVNIQATDFAYSDSLAITFPAGVTVVDAGPDVLGYGGGPYGPEPFNGINGQTISWGTNANDGAGGIYGQLTVWATLTFDDTLSGDLTTYYHISDDWWDTPLDVDGSFNISQRDLFDGDLLGYNVYIDGNTAPANTSIIEQTSYLVTELTNGQTYSFDVTAVYYPNYESDPMNVSVTPTWMFGDISGTVTDPNGVVLDSAIVRVSDYVDTTGADGTYLLNDLEPGVHTVTVQRRGFENTSEDVTVIAQAAAVTHNFVLTPSLAKANGLEAFAGDMFVDLIWKKPGSGGSYDLAYYDDVFEAQIGCDADCEFGVRFTPLGYPAVLTTIYLSFQGGGTVTGANIYAYIDENGSIGGPGGIAPIILATGVDLSSPDDGSLIQYEIDVSAANVVINSGDIYITVNENNTGFMGIANDIEPQSPEFYDRNWVGLGDGSYLTIFDAVGGDPSLTGDFGVLATFDGPSLAAITMDGNNEIVELNTAGSYEGVLKAETDTEFDIESLGYERDQNPINVIKLADIHIPEASARTETDSLIGYNVYHSLDDGDTLVHTTSGPDDTTATISVPANYVEYCYNVKARWNTDNYGILEAKPSNDACTVPYKLGDVDFDNAVDLTDLLMVVDYVLETSSPSYEQSRGADVNADGTISINDVVMIVDIIYGTAARTLPQSEGEVIADLTSTDQELMISLDYAGLTRGVQFTLRGDKAVSIGTPLLAVDGEGTMVVSNQSEDGTLTVVVFNGTGGTVDRDGDMLVRIPYKFTGSRNDKAMLELTDIQVAGILGQALPVTIREKRVEIVMVPSIFALHQNYPNPFNPVTEIQFDVPIESQVRLTVYNIMGQEVRTLTNETLKAGFHSIRWDGTNGLGESVSTGLYFYRLSSSSFTSTKKMVMVK